MLWGADVVGRTSEGSDNTVLGGCRGAGGVLGVEVGVGCFVKYFFSFPNAYFLVLFKYPQS